MGSLRELSHTADVGFEVRGEDLAELFELAAEGLARARGAEAAADPAVETERVEMSRPDLDRLLVAWLRELLYRAGRDNRVPSASVKSISFPGARETWDAAGGDGRARLTARVAWRPEADGPVREIKGVTYHGLEVRREGGRWHARVVLDV